MPPTCIAYLRRNPDFLDAHPEALRLLRPPAREIEGGVADFQHFLLERQRRDLARLNIEHKTLIVASRGNLASQAGSTNRCWRSSPRRPSSNCSRR